MGTSFFIYALKQGASQDPDYRDHTNAFIRGIIKKEASMLSSA
jgi:hypothetical protein